MNFTKQSVPKIATSVWVIGLVLSGFLLSIPPARVPVFLGLGVLAFIPLVMGSRHYQIYGIVAVVGSLMLAYWEYEAGLRHKARMERLQQAIIEKQKTNSPWLQPTK